MLDQIRSIAHGWVGKALLVVITVPFALFGIDSYLSGASNSAAVAEIGSNKISVQEYDNALKNMRNRLQSEGKFDPALLNTPELKGQVLNQLINKQLLNDEIKREKFAISDTQLATYITEMPDFQKSGKFSQELYDQILAQNQLTPTKFEAAMRADLLVQQAQNGIMNLAFVTNANAEKLFNLTNQQRVVTTAEIKTKDFIDSVKVAPEDVKAYYEKHKDKLVNPEQVKVEFLLLSAADFIAKANVDDAEVKKYYDQNADKFKGNEERSASHILIAFGANPTPEKKQAAKEKAEKLLAEIKKDPSSFESLATKNSDDPGSAAKGGDLGTFGRGVMVKPFDDAVFSMKVNDVSDLVESPFGYHIIKLNGITGAATDFESVKSQIKGDLLYKKAQEEFAKQAEGFSNMVYEQSGSLAPAAKAYGLQVQTSDWLSRESGAKFFKDNTNIMNLIFSDEVRKDHRNSEAVEVSPNNLVSARVIAYKPSAPKSFDELKSGIEEFLRREAASKLAISKGEAYLKDLREGKEATGLEWIPEVTIDRKTAQGLTELAMSQAFKTDVTKLPAYSGQADGQQGYLIVKVIKVEAPAATDVDTKKETKGALNAALANEYLTAYRSSLRDKAKVKINEKLLLNANN